MQITTLKKADIKDIAAIASIHQKVLEESILNRFGYTFLLNLYKNICYDKNNIIQIVTLNNKIIGYSVATKNISSFYKNAFYKNFLRLSLEIIKNLKGNLTLIYNIFIWILTPKGDDRYLAELQFLAILPKYQRKGLGTKLISLLKQELSKDNINVFKVGTKAENIHSNNFYKNKRFVFLYQKRVFGETFNYYLFKITA